MRNEAENASQVHFGLSPAGTPQAPRLAIRPLNPIRGLQERPDQPSARAPAQRVDDKATVLSYRQKRFFVCFMGARGSIEHAPKRRRQLQDAAARSDAGYWIVTVTVVFACVAPFAVNAPVTVKP